MIRRRVRGRAGWLVATAALCAVAMAGTALAQSASGYDLSWRAFAGGANANSADGNYQLRSVVGQTFTAHSGGGAYTVDSGFLGGQTGKAKRFLPQLAKDGTD